LRPEPPRRADLASILIIRLNKKRPRVSQFPQVKSSFLIILATILGAGFAAAGPIVPTENGMTWRYRMTEEAGEGLRFSNAKADENGTVQMPVAYRIDGTQKMDGRELLKFEMHRGGTVTNTDLLDIDEHQVLCRARIDSTGDTTKLEPPQIIVSPELRDGASWDYDTTIGGAQVHQHTAVVAEQSITVPAGKFDAFKLHTEQSEPAETIEDRWFVRGVGIVKDVTTIRNNEGDLVRRVTLELQALPKIAPRPEVATKKLAGSVSTDAVGAAAAKIDPAVDKIYARWQGSGLPHGARIRVVWIAENIGDVAPPNYTIDEARTTATAADSHGLFTLSRPEDGWAPGDYRVEFYLDDTLADTAKIKIGKSDAGNGLPHVER
jgi:hypothetical protein